MVTVTIRTARFRLMGKASTLLEARQQREEFMRTIMQMTIAAALITGVCGITFGQTSASASLSENAPSVPTTADAGSDAVNRKLRTRISQRTSDSFYKWEVFAGYQFAVTEESLRFNNVFASAGGNFHKYVGVKVEVTGAFENHLSNDGNFKVADRRLLFLGGPQIKNNSTKAKVKPFAHALFGLAILTQRNCSVANGNCINVNPGSNHFAMSFGGGLDVKLNKRMDIRLFQVDYNPIAYRSNFWGHTFRIGVGLVFH